MKSTLRLIIAVGGLSASGVTAEETSGWDHQAVIYFIGAGLTGDIEMKGVSVPVDMDLGDILENLEFGFMGAYRMQKETWSLGTDVIYMGLGTSGKKGQAELDVDQWIVELNGGYEVRPFFTLLGGLRYNSYSNRLFFPASENEVKATEDWLDPFVGGRLSWPFGSEWKAHLRGDVGGFGIGSDLAWQVMPILELMPSARLSALLAYRVIGTDYENEDHGFKYDMTVSGPSLGLVAHF